MGTYMALIPSIYVGVKRVYYIIFLLFKIIQFWSAKNAE